MVNLKLLRYATQYGLDLLDPGDEYDVVKTRVRKHIALTAFLISTRLLSIFFLPYCILLFFLSSIVFASFSCIVTFRHLFFERDSRPLKLAFSGLHACWTYIFGHLFTYFQIPGFCWTPPSHEAASSLSWDTSSATIRSRKGKIMHTIIRPHPMST